MKDEQIEKLMTDWRNSIDDYARSKAECDYLKEFRKSKKALLMNDALSNGIEAANAQERYAYSHDEYVELLQGLRAATEKSEQLRWRMRIAEERIGVWRTQQANTRREFGNYGN